jgi:hypothetical protein
MLIPVHPELFNKRNLAGMGSRRIFRKYRRVLAAYRVSEPLLADFPFRAACAAARRAIGTRNGEHDT